jgi:hypothetical protein
MTRSARPIRRLREQRRERLEAVSAGHVVVRRAVAQYLALEAVVIDDGSSRARLRLPEPGALITVRMRAQAAVIGRMVRTTSCPSSARAVRA